MERRGTISGFGLLQAQTDLKNVAAQRMGKTEESGKPGEDFEKFLDGLMLMRKTAEIFASAVSKCLNILSFWDS